MTTYTIRYDGEESLSIECDGKHITSLNHDDDGWAGMEAGVSIIKKVAEITGAELVIVDGEEE